MTEKVYLTSSHVAYLQSTVMVLKNMVSFEDVDDELEGEVNNFNEVVSIVNFCLALIHVRTLNRRLCLTLVTTKLY